MDPEIGDRALPPYPEDLEIARVQIAAAPRRWKPEKTDGAGEAPSGSFREVLELGIALSLYRDLTGRYFVYGKARGKIRRFDSTGAEDPSGARILSCPVRDDTMSARDFSVQEALREFASFAERMEEKSGGFYRVTNCTLCGASFVQAEQEEEKEKKEKQEGARREG